MFTQHYHKPWDSEALKQIAQVLVISDKVVIQAILTSEALLWWALTSRDNWRKAIIKVQANWTVFMVKQLEAVEMKRETEKHN